MTIRGFPERQGLYDPRNEHDACGIGFVADIKNRKSHEIIEKGLKVLKNLTHRGAVGADPLAGDGAGILMQIPDRFFRDECDKLGIALPEPGAYGVGMVFLPRDLKTRNTCESLINEAIAEEGQVLLGWRDVPVSSEVLGDTVRLNEPVIRQVLIGRGPNCPDIDSFERKLFVIRKVSARGGRSAVTESDAFYVTSMSARTLCYKGLLLAEQIDEYYHDLRDPRVESGMALVHQRFSTNTFPTWDLAQPFRMICHNGEINTKRGNENWMAARRQSMHSDILGADLDKLWPLIREGQSDSASFDNALELLIAGGYSLSHAMMLMIPEAWDNNPLMDEKRRSFYEYFAAVMEPWDGPAAVAFTDGRQIGATLDRNGLRPARFVVTADDLVVMASEVGVLDIPEDRIVKKWRLQPGRMFLVDLEEGRIIDDEEIKRELATSHPYQDWLDANQIKLEELPPAAAKAPAIPDGEFLDLQQAFGYTQEDLTVFLDPMAARGEDPVGSMGTDTPISVLSDQSKLLYTYFKQNFAQVTNPAIDPIREELVMSLVSLIGPRPNLFLSGDGAVPHKRLEVRQPILTDDDLERIREIETHKGSGFRALTLDITYPAENGAKGMEAALALLCAEAQIAVGEGYNILILSDRGTSAGRIAIPALLATSGVHHHLVREGLRTEVGLVVETGEAREVHHFCVLAGYGAEAINPYLAFETLRRLARMSPDTPSEDEVVKNYIKAVDKGILKVMSKMGISTYQSYCGAQIFDAVGLASSFVDRYFTGTATMVEGADLAEIAEESTRRHALAYGEAHILRSALHPGGEYAFRIRGEQHMWTPQSVSKLQHAVRAGNPKDYEAFSRLINEQSERLMTLRGLFDIQYPETGIDISEVEPASEIVKRFATGAMSFGSISREAHTNLAIAMNRIGGKSNTGEGGEERDRFQKLPNGDSMRSAIKQVASGRFGVTAEYLVNSDDIQIKIAQGAKPGEGGQLPGHKVDETIARVRYSTPGVGLISPPPHHDIYSIEDLAQLIHDLKNVNPGARISVKLVSEVGVGTVAAGVSKAHADHVTIAGFEGGTGASPLTSIKHAGSPWEIGLAETHQTLVLNRLRGRIAVQVDGGFRTGRDVVIGALLGADEFGFATAPLVASGCVMMRKCHLNTCPVGVATQDPVLRKRFAGQPEHVINYFFFVAEEVRGYMAKLGFRKFDGMIGRSDVLNKRHAIDHWKSKGLDFTRILHKPEVGSDVAVYNSEAQDHGLEKALDNELIELAAPALEEGKPVRLEMPIRNTNRTVGAMLSGRVARRYGHEGLKDDTVHIKFHGTAGQSFGAFLARGITFELEGEANDYVGKGLSGGRLIAYPPKECPIIAEKNILIGNTVLYGAIEGECYFRGVAGERFMVRNSGAHAVIEGTGDHGCEYMTGGVAVVIGPVGRNFAAGMSGGIAYVLDENGDFERYCNKAMVTLESINPGEAPAPLSALADHLRHDAQRLKLMIERHREYTQSSRAAHILGHWDSYLAKFVKVTPVDYRRALLERERTAETPARALASAE